MLCGLLVLALGVESDAEQVVAFDRRLFEAERVRAPNDKKRLTDTANTHAWLADALQATARPLEALTERQAAARMLDLASEAFPFTVVADAHRISALVDQLEPVVLEARRRVWRGEAEKGRARRRSRE